MSEAVSARVNAVARDLRTEPPIRIVTLGSQMTTR